MKKKIMLKLTFALLLVCVITTSLIGTTLAKYVSTGSNLNTARVAKWGITIDAGTQMFGNSYVNAAGGNGVATEGDLTVDAIGDALVVAPGTHGTMGAISVAGTPEVSVKLTAVANVNLGANWTIKVNDSFIFYCPIVFTVNGTTIDGKTFSDADLLENAISTAFDKTLNFTPGATINETLEVSWAWAFESGDDVKDTALGNRAATVIGAPSITFNISVTAEQVD